MPTISGSLKYVTSRPAAVTEVWVRASRLRTSGDGVVTSSNDRIPVADGQVSFDALPGPAVLALVESGRPVETIPILVGDAAAQSLSVAVDAGAAADSGDVNALEAFAQQVADDVAKAQAAAQASGDSATASEISRESAGEAAGTATTKAGEASVSARDAKTSEVNAKLSETNAGESAGAAGRAATDAEGSATTASTKAGEASASATNAEQERKKAELESGRAKAEAERAHDEADRAQVAADSADPEVIRQEIITRISDVVDGSPEDLDTIREVAEYAQANRDITDALNAAIGQKAGKQELTDGLAGKADTSHTHITEQVTGLDTALAGKASTQALTDGLATRVEGGSAVKKIEVVTAMPSNPVATTLYLVVG